MDSSRGALSGSFTLTYTSINGEKKTTRSISTAPELSSTVTVSGPERYDLTYCKQANALAYEDPSYLGACTNANGATSDGTPAGQLTRALCGIGGTPNGNCPNGDASGVEACTTFTPLFWAGASCEKLIKFSPDLPDDELAVGDYIRIGNEIRKIGSLVRSTDTGNYSSAYVTAQFNQAYAAGTYAYRHNAHKAIEYALEHLSNDVVGEVTATKSKSSGKILLNVNPADKLHTRIATGGSAVTFVKVGTTASGTAPGSVSVGDIFRVHAQDGMSQIEVVTESGGVVTGLTTDAEFLANSGDTADLGANLRTISTDNNFDVGSVPIVDNGFKYKIKFEANSGDLPDLTCNTDNLRSVYRMDQAAYVTRDEPDRVWFVDTKQGR